MKSTTLQMIRLTLDGDDSLTPAERSAILAFCRQPLHAAPSDSPAPTASPAFPSSSDRWMTPAEAGEVLSLSPRTIQRLLSSGTLPSTKILGCRRIPWSGVQKLHEGTSEAEICRLFQPTGAANYLEKA